MKSVLQLIQKTFKNRRNTKREKINQSLPWTTACSMGAQKDFDDLLDEYSQYTKKLKEVFPFRNNEFDRWVMPAVNYIAEYYLYLPSENELYRKPSGAFQDALKTAILAVNLVNSNSTVYRHVDGENRFKYKFTAPFAVFLIALFYGTGEFIVNYQVLACDANQTIDKNVKAWEPKNETIFDWVKKNKVRYYRCIFDGQLSDENWQIYNEIALNKLKGVFESFEYPDILEKLIMEMRYQIKNEMTDELLLCVNAAIASSKKAV